MLRSRLTARLLEIAGVGAAYYLTGKLGLLLAIPPGYATAIWPPAGIAFAAVFLRGYRVCPGVFLGSLAVNIGTSLDGTGALPGLAVAAGIASGATLQAALGALLVQRWLRMPAELLHEQEIAKFFLAGGPLSCLTNATLGVGCLWLAGLISTDQYAFSWWTWWVGDSVGVLCVAPLLLVAFGRPRDLWRRRSLPVALPLGVVLAATLVLFIWVSAVERARIRADFANHTTRVSGVIADELDDAIHVLRSLTSIVESFPDVDHHTFAGFARRILGHHPGLHALSWNSRVAAADRPAFETAARRAGLRRLQHHRDGCDRGQGAGRAPRRIRGDPPHRAARVQRRRRWLRHCLRADAPRGPTAQRCGRSPDRHRPTPPAPGSLRGRRHPGRSAGLRPDAGQRPRSAWLCRGRSSAGHGHEGSARLSPRCDRRRGGVRSRRRRCVVAAVDEGGANPPCRRGRDREREHHRGCR